MRIKYVTKGVFLNKRGNKESGRLSQANFDNSIKNACTNHTSNKNQVT